MIPVISLRHRFLAKLHLGPNLMVEVSLGLFHLCVEDMVVLVSHSLVSLLLFLVRDPHRRGPTRRTILLAWDVRLFLKHIVHVRVFGDGCRVP